jgi:hypothetical protein
MGRRGKRGKCRGEVARGKERRGRKEVKGIMLPCYHNDGIG